MQPHVSDLQPHVYDLQPHVYDLQTHVYDPLEPCRARIVPTSGSPMVPIIKEDQRCPVIRGETGAVSGAKPAARAQPMSVLSGSILL